MIIREKKEILLGEFENNKYYLVECSKTEEQEILKAIENNDGSKYPFFENVHALGKSLDYTNIIARSFIPVDFLKNDHDENNKKISIKEYRCYASRTKVMENNVITHEDSLSSLKCALQCIGNPQYSYIVKRKIEKYATNNSRNTSVCEKSEDVRETTTGLL